MIAFASAGSTKSTSTSATNTIDIGKDFSLTPGGRYRKLGPHSGQEFREDVLLPRLRQIIAQGGRLCVRIDGVKRSYQSSFLDEAFAGLIRDEGIAKNDLAKHLAIVADIPRFEKYKALAEKYIADAGE